MKYLGEVSAKPVPPPDGLRLDEIVKAAFNDSKIDPWASRFRRVAPPPDLPESVPRVEVVPLPFSAATAYSAGFVAEPEFVADSDGSVEWFSGAGWF